MNTTKDAEGMLSEVVKIYKIAKAKHPTLTLFVELTTTNAAEVGKLPVTAEFDACFWQGPTALEWAEWARMGRNS